MSDQDRFRDELRDALGYGDEPSDDLVDMIMTGYDIVGLDVTIAPFVYDSSRDGDLVLVRGEDSVRALTAEGQTVTLELEVVESERRLSGRVLPPQPGTVYLDQEVVPQAVSVDEAGAFEFNLGTGSFRVRFDPDDGEQIATEWLTHGDE